MYYTTKGIEAWLSLVERCVRDAEAACSNHVASIHLWPDGQAAKTTPSHGVNPGSIPGQVIDGRLLHKRQPFSSKGATVAQLVAQRIRNAWVAGSSPASGL